MPSVFFPHSMAELPARRSQAARNIAASVALICSALLLIPSRVAFSGEYEPTGIVADTMLTPGQPLACQIGLSGPEAAVTVYSYPPNAVSFQGTVRNGATIYVLTNPALPSGQSIVVYMRTDGQRVVATSTEAYTTMSEKP